MFERSNLVLEVLRVSNEVSVEYPTGECVKRPASEPSLVRSIFGETEIISPAPIIPALPDDDLSADIIFFGFSILTPLALLVYRSAPSILTSDHRLAPKPPPVLSSR